MTVPQIQVQTTPGKLGLTIDKPVQQIEQPKATMEQQQPAAILEISTTPSQLSIDTTAVREDIDQKSSFRRTEEYAQLGRQAAMDGVGRRASEGQQLLKIENGGNVIADLAKQNGTPPPAPLEFDLLEIVRRYKCRLHLVKLTSMRLRRNQSLMSSE